MYTHFICACVWDSFDFYFKLLSLLGVFCLLCLHNGTRIITHFYYFYGPMKRSMLHCNNHMESERERANKIDVHVNAYYYRQNIYTTMNIESLRKYNKTTNRQYTRSASVSLSFVVYTHSRHNIILYNFASHIRNFIGGFAHRSLYTFLCYSIFIIVVVIIYLQGDKTK